MTSNISELSTFLSQSMDNESYFHIVDTENEYDFPLFTQESSLNYSNQAIEPFQAFNHSDSLEEEEEKENKKLYYIEKNEKSLSSSKIFKFITKEENNLSKSDSSQILKKKRGRGRNGNIESNIKIHDKFSTDNLLRKIQVHYLTFIVNFLNDILSKMKFEQRFFKLDYGIKKNVNKKYVESLKNQSIAEIICNKISVKYRKQDEYANIKVYEIIKENEVLNRILSENYLKLFKKIYFKSNNTINLKEYGLDENIVLSKQVKMFKDLLKDNEALDINKEYIKNIKECAVQNFIPDSIFLYF